MTQTPTDLDFLGSGSHHWNKADVLSAMPDDGSIRGVGAFWNGWPHAFGDPRDFIGACVNQKHVKNVRFQLFYNKPHTLVDLPYLQLHLPEVQKFAVNHPSAKVFISPSTEYKSTDSNALHRILDIVKHLAPSCTPVFNPNSGYPGVAGQPLERHGPKATSGPGNFASLDGFSATDGDVEGWLANQHGAFAGLYCFEFSMNVAGGTQEPDQRTISPTADQVRSIIRLGSPKGTPPASSINPIPFDQVNLYKSHAENNGKDVRGNHPCIILTEHASHLDIVDCLGNVIEQAQLTTIDGGKFEPSPLKPVTPRWRYYASEYGFKIGQKALKSSGSEFVSFIANDKHFGWCNPAFRTGSHLW